MTDSSQIELRLERLTEEQYEQYARLRKAGFCATTALVRVEGESA